jgi:hypothetical protein
MAESPRHGLIKAPLTVRQRDQDYNANVAIQDVLIQPSMIDQTNTPPGSPTEGDCYLLDTAPTGAWDGHANELAQYLNSGWTFFEPAEGWLIYLQDTDVYMSYNGSAWAAVGDLTTPGTINLSDLGTKALTDLDDAPSAYTGAEGKLLAVNSTPDAIEFIAKSAINLADLGTKTLLNLSDTPSDYTDDGGKLLAVNAGATAVEFIAAPEELQGNFEGVPGNSAVVFRRVAGRAMSIPDDFAGSQAVAGVAATAETVFTIEKNGSGVGTLTFAIAGTTGTWATTAGALSLAAGDLLTITGPADNDDTLADLAITIIGTRG